MEEEVQQGELNEARPNEGEIEEGVERVDLDDSPEDVTDDEPDDGDQL